MKIAFLTIALLAIAILMLGVRVFFTQNGKFLSGHVHNNAHLRNKGIGCAVQSHNKKIKQ